MDASAWKFPRRPFPELASAIRSSAGEILLEWERAVRQLLPQTSRLTFEELEDSIPAVLTAVADRLASAKGVRGLAEQAASQGETRFNQHYDVAEVMQEERLLRAVLVDQVEATLGRQMASAEAAALHTCIDMVARMAVMTLLSRQRARLRAAAELELKYLAFLSHELSNNLSGVLVFLDRLAEQAGAGPLDHADIAATLARAARTVRDTIAGMRRFLEHERLRKAGEPVEDRPVDLAALAGRIVSQFEREASGKGLTLVASVPPGARVMTDLELVGLVLQNLVGNAVKYSTKGTVRIGARPPHRVAGVNAGWVLSVSDEGSGIAPTDLRRIFKAFQRGGSHDEPGVGLGLAVAAEATKLLGAELKVDSQVGAGSTFSLFFPFRAAT